MITYAIEDYETYRRDAQALWEEQYEELKPSHEGRMALSVEEELYQELDRLGVLQIACARDNGALVGFCSVVVRPHYHYSQTLCGFEDTYYLTKTHRKGMTGVKLLRFTVERLRERGVERVYFMNSLLKDIGPILNFLGMKKTEEVYSMWLGG